MEYREGDRVIVKELDGDEYHAWYVRPYPTAAGKLHLIETDGQYRRLMLEREIVGRMAKFDTREVW